MDQPTASPKPDPLLSICIPTYNRADLLKRTLRSFEDGNKEVEVVICDNSNNIDSRKVAEETMQTFIGSWAYYKNEPPIGPIENVNKAVRLSRGKFIYVLHDDDFLYPGGLLAILAKLKQYPGQKVFTFGVKIVDINEKPIKVEAPAREMILPAKIALHKTLSDSSYIRMPSIIIRRDCYEKVGYWDPQTAPPDDIDMFVRLFMEYDLMRIPTVVAAYTVHEGAWTEKVFNSETVKILLNTFGKVNGKFSKKELQKAKGYFFHQFILGGAYRAIKKKDYEKGRSILNLFQIEEIKKLPPPLKWLPARLLFTAIIKFKAGNKE